MAYGSPSSPGTSHSEDPKWEKKRKLENPVVFFDVGISGHNIGRVIVEVLRTKLR
jgi:hypothetical protein